jgi:hypothetical protein
VGANPIPIVLPCHRVIARDGSLGGYSGGLSIKKKLLELERVTAGHILSRGPAPVREIRPSRGR